MTKPSVSILIPCYNAAKWINQCLESSLSQSWSDLEVIVIDDGSTDGSAQLLEGWKERIQVFCRENRGGNPTRNELLQRASGEWVQFLDADDFLKPQKIERQMEVAKANPSSGVIYSPLTVEHHSAKGISTTEWDPHDPSGNHDPWAYHLGWNLTQTGGALFHREKLISQGGWKTDQACCQDNEVFFRLLKARLHFVRCGHAGAVYRRFEGGSVSTNRQSLVVDEILRLIDEGESWLESKGELTRRRRQAANQHRLALARTRWPDDPDSAAGIVQRIRESDPRFKPAPATHAPALYCIAWRLFGFRGAERISEWKRTIIRK